MAFPTVRIRGRFGYTGQTWIKELGLNYYKAKIYSPKIGRFLQTDPIFDKDDMNLYAYVGNDPIATNDPSGKSAEVVIPVIVITGYVILSNCAATPSCSELTGEMATSFINGATNLLEHLGKGIHETLVGVPGVDRTHHENEGEEAESTDEGDRNAADDQRLTKGEIKKLTDAGEDAEQLKGGTATGSLDLFKDKKGNIYVKPKDGSGPGDPTGLNINNY
jgi:RHS repeat-associated protein